EGGQSLTVPASETMPHAWIQVISGEVNAFGETLQTADGLAIEDAPDSFGVEASADCQFLLFRLS
ncbi:MAG: hypothetical protein AAGA96_16040, partial [Verrucomicrobiota bacterium]